MRTLIDLPDALAKQVDAIAGDENISRAEAVRRALAEYVAKRTSSRPDAAFGIWKLKHLDALDYEDSLRAEWRR